MQKNQSSAAQAALLFSRLLSVLLGAVFLLVALLIVLLVVLLILLFHVNLPPHSDCGVPLVQYSPHFLIYPWV